MATEIAYGSLIQLLKVSLRRVGVIDKRMVKKEEADSWESASCLRADIFVLRELYGRK